MPVTRGRARLMESQEEDAEEESSQQMQESHEEQDQQQQQTATETDSAVVDLKEMAKQLTKTLKHLLTTHRQLESDAAMIQAGMDELHRMQEDRAQHIIGRLKNASSTILTFGDSSQGECPENERDIEDEMVD
ncbi:ABC transporter permease [Phytophthora palmivora]|uniref:ABC transporter permease n=1 Tax=Phytophthora palmivora TaxID=4796 RepID=A0A2P4YGW2_9STRA|nr:ABC transporter permease [Phytophthora palmivora]